MLGLLLLVVGGAWSLPFHQLTSFSDPYMVSQNSIGAVNKCFELKEGRQVGASYLIFPPPHLSSDPYMVSQNSIEAVNKCFELKEGRQGSCVVHSLPGTETDIYKQNCAVQKHLLYTYQDTTVGDLASTRNKSLCLLSKYIESISISRS